MYTQVSQAQNRRDEETDLALPWARYAAAAAVEPLDQPLMFYRRQRQRNGEGQEGEICALLIVWRFRRSRAKPPLREIVLRNRGISTAFPSCVLFGNPRLLDQIPGLNCIRRFNCDIYEFRANTTELCQQHTHSHEFLSSISFIKGSGFYEFVNTYSEEVTGDGLS